MGKKNLIWSSEINLENWEEILSEHPDMNETEQYCFCHDINQEYLEDEKANLSDCTYPHPILCIADIGRWDGRIQGYRFFGNEEGSSLPDIFSFSVGDAQEWFVEDGKLRCNDIHHDATNHYEYYVLNCTPKEADPLLDCIAMQKDYSNFLKNYTINPAEDVCKVYGW